MCEDLLAQGVEIACLGAEQAGTTITASHLQLLAQGPEHSRHKLLQGPPAYMVARKRAMLTILGYRARARANENGHSDK